MTSFCHFPHDAVGPYYRLEAICNFSTACFVRVSIESLSDFWDLKMADDGAISDGSDIDDGDTEIGSNTGSSLTSLSSESDLDERHALGEQWVRNLFAEDNSDNSVFAGFQAAWKKRNFVQRVTMAFRGIGSTSTRSKSGDVFRPVLDW